MYTKFGGEDLKNVSYNGWCNIKKPYVLSNDAFDHFDFLDYEGNQIAKPVPPSKLLVQEGGRKKTRRNRKFSMHKKHKQNCNCKFCLYGGGKRKSMKKRRQTKKRRHRK